jgi:hypothetical protein
MAFLPLRSVEIPAHVNDAYQQWLDRLADRLADPDCDRVELCRSVLTEIYYPAYAGKATDSLPDGARIALHQMDPRYFTLEPEYYAEIDIERYARV